MTKKTADDKPEKVEKKPVAKESPETTEEPILPDGAGNPVVDGVSVPKEEFEKSKE